MTGEFAVLSQLALHGLVANLTLGNTKGVDILVLNPDTKRMYRLEVKTRFRKQARKSKMYGHVFEWVMSKKHAKLIDRYLFYCFVNIDESDAFRFFLVPGGVVAKYVKNEHREWKRRRHPKIDNDMRMFRLKIRNGTQLGRTLPTPLADEYEGTWDQLRN